MKDKIRDYVIQKQIGTGGMSTVYKAIHPALNVPVIIKKLDLLEHETEERFKREAKILMGLRHDNIVTVYDYFTEGSDKYIVMEYIHGVPLSTALEKRGFLDVRVAMLIFREIAQGLSHAHSKGVVHRDLKPSNIIISQKGEVKIIDFGIAAASEEREKDETKVALTQTGLSMGTPAYMSPEQLRDLRLATTLSDIYSLGIIFHEMLSGYRPYDIQLNRQKKKERNISELPFFLRRIISRCIHEKSDKRFKDVLSAAKKMNRFFKNISSDEKKEIIAEYIYKNRFNDSYIKCKPVYSSFFASFIESPYRKYSLIAGIPSIIACGLCALILFTDAYYIIFKRNTYGKAEILFNFPLSPALRQMNWYRSEKKLPDKKRNPGLYEDRAKELASLLYKYIRDEYADLLFNFKTNAWLIHNKEKGKGIIKKEKLILSPKTYVRVRDSDDFEITAPESGEIPTALTLSSGIIFREKGEYTCSMVIGGVSYRTHFFIPPINEHNDPTIIAHDYSTAPRNKVNFTFTFIDRNTKKSIENVDIKIYWAGTYQSWKDFSAKKVMMDNLLNGRTYYFKFEHPDYKTLRNFEIRVDRDQTIAHLVIWLERIKRDDEQKK